MHKFIIILGLIVATSVMGNPMDAATPGATEGDSRVWTDFVVHVREGNVDELVRGGKCMRTSLGCARRKSSLPDALLDGECWITVPKWDVSTREKLASDLATRGHELSHCTRGKWHP